ncbi:MAG TPA: signal recognition particle protein [Candidatus Krumholzibacteria bacterium]|nr:signal recognition particle protein [Candidatus Krumholzibacteria bacterium]
MFESLSQRLDGVLRRLRSQASLTEDNIRESLREVRQALLEADVQLQVAREFVATVQSRAIGQEVHRSLQPGQQLIKLVHEELVTLLGGQTADLQTSGAHPAVFLLVGLQGSGKTTLAAKLGALLLRRGHKPLLVAADIYRPAAAQQLEILGAQVGVPVFARADLRDVPEIALQARRAAREQLRDVLIIDSAGRLHVDEELMRELEAVRAAVPPQETLLVLDAMTGQEALRVAQEFDRRIALTGVALTKLDGDARGGAALSLRRVLGKPIKLVGVGEGLGDLETFHPDRMAQRILGMGDVLTLAEKAQEVYDENEALELERKVRRQSLTLDDFLTQLQAVRKMGPLDKVLGLLPGVSTAALAQARENIDARQIDHVQGIVHSMTPQERRNPRVIDGSRRRRIAKGSGTSVQEVNQLLTQFEQMKRMMKSMTSSNPGQAVRAATRSVAAGNGRRRFGNKRKRR